MKVFQSWVELIRVSSSSVHLGRVELCCDGIVEFGKVKFNRGVVEWSRDDRVFQSWAEFTSG